MRSAHRLVLASSLALGFGLGCGTAGDSKSTLDPATGLPTATSTSRLRVALTSSARVHGGGGPVHDLQAAHVFIDRVTAHGSGGWVTIRDGIAVDVDVLRLGDSAVDLGFADLPAGEVNQIRLHVSTATVPYVITASGEHVPLKVPSGTQSGLKIKGVWTATTCGQLTVSVDLDSPHAIQIHPTGHGDLYILRPVIRASGESEPMAECPTDPQPGTDDPNEPGEPTDGTGSDPSDPTGGTTGGDPGTVSPDPGSGSTGGDTGTGTGTTGGDTGSGEPTGSTGGGTGTGTTGGDTGSGEPSGSTGGGTGTVPPDGSGTGPTCNVDLDCPINAYCSATGTCISL